MEWIDQTTIDLFKNESEYIFLCNMIEIHFPVVLLCGVSESYSCMLYEYLDERQLTLTIGTIDTILGTLRIENSC